MKYLSKYSNGKSVSAAQYITEIICEHLAAKDKKDLHYRFWISKDWEKFYKSQIFTAHKLLAKYSDKAIIRALQSTKGKKIFSLRAPHLASIIEQEQERLESQTDTQNVPVQRATNTTGHRPQHKKTTLDKLKDIDNEH